MIIAKLTKSFMAVALLTTPMAAHAISIGTEGGADVKVNTGTRTGVNADIHTGVQGTANTNTNMRTHSGIQAETDADTATQSHIDQELDANTRSGIGVTLGSKQRESMDGRIETNNPRLTTGTRSDVLNNRPEVVNE